MTGAGRTVVHGLMADRRVRFLVSSGVAATVYYALFALGWAVLPRSVPYVCLALAANVTTAATAYPIQRRLVFRATGPWLPGLLRFILLCLGAALFVLAGLPVLVEVVHLHVLLAQALVVAASPLVTYELSRRWAFRHPAD